MCCSVSCSSSCLFFILKYFFIFLIFSLSSNFGLPATLIYILLSVDILFLFSFTSFPLVRVFSYFLLILVEDFVFNLLFQDCFFSCLPFFFFLVSSLFCLYSPFSVCFFLSSFFSFNSFFFVLSLFSFFCLFLPIFLSSFFLVSFLSRLYSPFSLFSSYLPFFFFFVSSLFRPYSLFSFHLFPLSCLLFFLSLFLVQGFFFIVCFLFC